MARVVYLVAGPPCAGKSTYVRHRARPGDLVLDQDVIGARAMAAGMRRVAAMTDGTAWVIRCAPGPTRRAELAAELGLPYVYSLFLGGDEREAVEAVRVYKERFRSSSGGDGSGNGRAEAIIAVAAVAADTDEEARALVPPFRPVKVKLANGQSVTVGSVEQAEAYGRQAGIPYTIEEKEMIVYAGEKETVLGKLLELQEATGVEEFMITTNIEPFDKRLRSFVLLQEALKEAGQVAS